MNNLPWQTLHYTGRGQSNPYVPSSIDAGDTKRTECIGPIKCKSIK